MIISSYTDIIFLNSYLLDPEKNMATESKTFLAAKYVNIFLLTCALILTGFFASIYFELRTEILHSAWISHNYSLAFMFICFFGTFFLGSFMLRLYSYIAPILWAYKGTSTWTTGLMFPSLVTLGQLITIVLYIALGIAWIYIYPYSVCYQAATESASLTDTASGTYSASVTADACTAREQRAMWILMVVWIIAMIVTFLNIVLTWVMYKITSPGLYTRQGAMFGSAKTPSTNSRGKQTLYWQLNYYYAALFNEFIFYLVTGIATSMWIFFAFYLSIYYTISFMGMWLAINFTVLMGLLLIGVLLNTYTEAVNMLNNTYWFVAIIALVCLGVWCSTIACFIVHIVYDMIPCSVGGALNPCVALMLNTNWAIFAFNIVCFLLSMFIAGVSALGMKGLAKWETLQAGSKLSKFK